MKRRLCLVIMLAALTLVTGRAMGAVLLPAATAICAVHVGPQDKPMPEFCVGAPGAADLPQAIQTDAETWRALRGLLEREARREPGNPVDFGWYQLRLAPDAGLFYLSPSGMRRLAALLRSVPGLTDAHAQMLQRLQARLR